MGSLFDQASRDSVDPRALKLDPSMFEEDFVIEEQGWNCLYPLSNIAEQVQEGGAKAVVFVNCE